MAGPAVISDEPGPDRATPYAWVVFALSFGLLMSDHMARQVLNAAGPQIKAEWGLGNAELASLASVVALAVGLLTLPLSYVADRVGRVRSLVAMAALWSLATLAGAWTQTYGQMLGARLLVGVGEAAYGSVGIAVVLAAFPRHLRATLSASFLAGSVVGQMIGIAAGAQIAASYGWRTAFQAIGLFGLILSLAYAAFVREHRLGGTATPQPVALRELVQLLLGRRLLWLTYLAGGIQLFCTGALAWALPLLLTENYAMPLAQAGRLAALFLLVCAIGMVGCGMLVDRMARHEPASTPKLSVVLSLLTAALFGGAFLSPSGPAQLALMGGGLLLVGGITGVTGAMIANCTPRAIHSSAMAVLALAYNLFGLAPGPYITGLLSDRVGLAEALRILPLPCLLAAGAMLLAAPLYRSEISGSAAK